MTNITHQGEWDQAEVNQFYMNLVNDLDDELYDDITLYLLELGQREPKITAPTHRHRELFKKRKAVIVRDLLQTFKDSAELEYSDEDLAAMVRGARKIGLAWPELDAMEKSLHASKDLRESGDMLGYRVSKGDLIDSMQDALRAGHSGAWANNYAHMRSWSTAHAVKQLSRIKPDIVAYVDRNLSANGQHHSNWRYAKQAVLDLDSLGVDWPELWLAVDRNKTAWLRPWLAEVADVLPRGHWDELIDLKIKIEVWQQTFEQHGIKWPEIQTILASIHNAYKEQDRIQEAESLMPFARREIDDLVKHTVIEIGHPNTSLALRSMIKQMFDKYKLDPEEFAEFTAPIKDNIIAFTDANLSGRAIAIGLGDIAMMAQYRVLLPELRAVINKNKTPIIRHMLSGIRDSENSNHASEYINRLEVAGIDWPELDAIKRSVSAETKRTQQQALDTWNRRQVDEDWDDADTDEIYGRVGQCLGDIENGLRPNMDDWHAEMANNGMANLAELLDQHDWLDTPTPSEYNLDLEKLKPLIIKSLLTGIKHSDIDNIRLALHLLEDYWRIRWSELGIINKSLVSDQNRPGRAVAEDWHDVDTDEYDEVNNRVKNLMYDIVDLISHLKRQEPLADGNQRALLHANKRLLYAMSDITSLLDSNNWLEAPNPRVYGLELDNNKDVIVKTLLFALKHTDVPRIEIEDTVSLLRDHWNVSWPELDIIGKSMDADKSKLNEYDQDNPDIRKVKQYLWNELPEGNWWAIGKAISMMRLAPLSHRDQIDILEEFKGDILTAENILLQADGAMVQAGLSNLELLYTAGMRWPELDAMLQKHKASIMREMLKEIKFEYSPEEYHGDPPILYDKLCKIGVGWPELDTIGRSLKASRKTSASRTQHLPGDNNDHE